MTTAADSSPKTAAREDYGIDAPTVVRNLFFGGLALLALSGVIALFQRPSELGPGFLLSLFRTGLFAGGAWVATALHMIYGSRVRKLRLRDRLLDELALRGDEQVLDVGCGRGLLLIGAARRLRSGRAFGLDLWQTVDQSGNCPEATLRNATIAGVRERIELHTGDAQKLPFADGTFDVIVSSWALHNIPTREGRDAAIAEIARVVKPGGRVLLVDISHSRDYAQALARHGLGGVRHRLLSFLFAIPTYRVDARKP